MIELNYTRKEVCGVKNYSIGLDIGTDSCGVAVIDSNYNLIKAKGKNIWGAVKFDGGLTAKERRVQRGTRRLLVRKKQRIRLFRGFVEEEIIKIDPSFFQRLEDSFKYREDRKDSRYKYNLFIDKDFNDEDYYEAYPTVYHLRERLIKDESKCDIRLIYLAIHHILKYRGNFLYEGQSFSQITESVNSLFEQLSDMCTDLLEVNMNLNIDIVIGILKDQNNSRKDKLNKVLNLEKYPKDLKDIIKEIFSGILGLQMNLSKIISDVDLGDLAKLKFSDSNIDEKLEAVEPLIGDNFKLIEKIKNIYSWLQLDDILKGNDYISEAMIGKYDKFENDLKILKRTIKENSSKEVYNEIFRSETPDKPNYYNYMNNKIKEKKNGLQEKRKAFYDEIKKVISDLHTDDANYIRQEIDEERFLIKLNTTENSVIPYQVNEIELKKILHNQGKYYTSLKENQEKIIKILTFRIPYYVGPLGKNGSFRWLERNDGQENSKILPWNLETVVDIDKTAEKFIDRMTSYCSYLPDEKVLPFNSILYTEYLYYNEINKVKFNGETLDKYHKELLKKEVFMAENNITEKRLKQWYKRTFPAFSDIEISGLQGDGKANVTLKPIRDFTRIYGKITDENIEEIEKIIYWLTVFEDKKIVERKLKKETNIIDSKIKEILKLNYSGWGRLSRKLLDGIKTSNGKYFKASIIDVLKESNLNFMQIINDDSLGFGEKIKEANGSQIIDKINFKRDIEPLQGSPSLRKSIGQAVKQIEEVVKLMGDTPKNIYIEFARSDEESKRTLARRDKLLALYEEIENPDKKDIEIIKSLKDKKIKIDSERLYLYYIQRGKCMYTQEPLDIDFLQTYDVDHIIPRSLIKDDSISNKVLVKKIENQGKSASVLKNKTIDRNIAWWSDLLKYKLISQKKFRNITNRSDNFGEEVEKGFINRQLVEVRQISKHVTNLLNRTYGHRGTNIVAVNAELSDDFKKQFNVYKSRDINDFHHAKDAYIVAILGEYIMTRFPNLKSEFIYDEFKKYKTTVTSKDKFGFVVSSMNHDYICDETGEIVWNSQKQIGKIKKILSYNDCIITKKTEVMNGQMFNLTRYPKPSNGKISSSAIPLKNNKNLYLDPLKYGYYQGKQESYYAIIEFTLKKKRVKRLVGVPIMVVNTVKNSKEKLKEYFENEGYLDVTIIKDKVPKYQKIRYEGHEYYIVSSNEWCNAKQLKLSQEYYDNICILNNRGIFIKMDEQEKNNKLIDIYQYIVAKLENQYSIYKKSITDLKEKQQKFVELKTEEKLQVINEILKLTKANSQCANLKLIGSADRVGRISGKENIDVNKLTFIYESSLGINRREVKY